MLALKTTALLLLIAQSALGVIFQKGREQRFDNGVSETTDAQFQSQCIEIHNKFRRMHGAPALSYNPQLAAYARQRAIDLARKDGTNFYHPDGLPYGENLAWNSQNNIDCGLPLKLWYDEWKIYNFQRPNISPANGHFTQMVWKQSRSIGCARVISQGKNGGTYTVCNYDPPGNYENEERENVQPAQGTSGGYDVTPEIQLYKRKKTRRTWIRTSSTGSFVPSVSNSGSSGNSWLTVQMPPSEYPSTPQIAHPQSIASPISSVFNTNRFGNSFGSGNSISNTNNNRFATRWGSGSSFQRIGAHTTSINRFGSGVRSVYNSNPYSNHFGYASTTTKPFNTFGGFSQTFGTGSSGWNSWSWKKK